MDLNSFYEYRDTVLSIFFEFTMVSGEYYHINFMDTIKCSPCKVIVQYHWNVYFLEVTMGCRIVILAILYFQKIFYKIEFSQEDQTRRFL